MKYWIGIDIGSTAAKTVVLGEEGVFHKMAVPTGWNSKVTAQVLAADLEVLGYPVTDALRVIATGYGRISVDFADRVVTEITCHGKGGRALLGEDCTIIDIGGQDTKVMDVTGGQVTDFLMNDKCAAGSGKFLEIMANRLNVTLEELFALAEKGDPLPISSMCTVFAESEVISHIGAGERREDIAAGVVDSVATRVTGLCARFHMKERVFLSGGLCESDCLRTVLSEKLSRDVVSDPDARYAGALGAALIARDGKR